MHVDVFYCLHKPRLTVLAFTVDDTACHGVVAIPCANGRQQYSSCCKNNRV